MDIHYRGTRFYITAPNSNTGQQETWLLMFIVHNFNSTLSIVHLDGYYRGHMFIEGVPTEKGHLGITEEKLKKHLEWFYKGYEFDSSTLKILPREEVEYPSIMVKSMEEMLVEYGATVEEMSSYATGEEVKYNVYQLGKFTYNQLQEQWYYGSEKINVKHFTHLKTLYHTLEDKVLKEPIKTRI